MSWFSHSKKGKGNHVTGPFTNGRKLPQEQTSSLIKTGKPGFLGYRVPCVLDRLTILLSSKEGKRVLLIMIFGATWDAWSPCGRETVHFISHIAP